MDWFRSHHGAPTDPKWRVIAKKAGCRPGDVAAIFWALMDFASQQGDRGDVNAFDRETLAAAYDYEEETISAVIDALESKGLIKNGRLTAWEKRQPKREDGSAERARLWRERERTQPTAQERPEQIQNRTDSEQKEEPPKAPRKRVACLNAHQLKIFDEWYALYPLHKARLAAEKAFHAALARASPAELLAGAARYRDECAGKEARFIAHPSTWLNQGRWKDENAGLNGTVYGLPERRRPTAPPSAHLLAGESAEGETAA